MKRNIITTVIFTRKKVSISVIEKLSSNIVEIYNASSNIDKTTTFLSSSLSHVEKLIGGKVPKITFVIEANKETQSEIKLSKDSFSIVGETITKIDIENFLNLVKTKNNSENKCTTLVQPIKFEVHDIMTKSYSRAPIHKPGKTLSIISAITTISRKMYDHIYHIAKSIDVEVAQILLTSQTTSFANLSENAMSEGSVLIHIGTNQVDISINRKGATIDTFSVYNFGFKHLIKAIAEKFNCDIKKALDIFSAHGMVMNKYTNVIHTSQIGVDDHPYTNIDLENIIKKYFSMLNAIIVKYLEQKKLTELPMVYSGKMNGIGNLNEFLLATLNTDKVSLYSPLSFIEMNDKNTHSIGTMNFIKNMDHILGKHYDTIVHTNPNSLKTLITHKKEHKGLINRLKNRIGEKYEWK